MTCRRAKKSVCVTSVLVLFSQPIKCHWQEDFSNTTDSLCIISQQFRSNGLGEVTKKRRKRFNRSRRKLWLLKKSKMLGELLPTSGSSSITKTSLTLKKSKCLWFFNQYRRGSPAQLLKSINPQEAGLLDAAARCHIRFRLGGDKFPPLIYYKIFTHGGLVDINAFAPRDYMKIKRDQKKATVNITFDKPKNDNFKGWYNRIENNGWRPISDKILTPYDQVEIETSNKPKKFHFDPKIRKELNAQQKR